MYVPVACILGILPHLLASWHIKMNQLISKWLHNKFTHVNNPYACPDLNLFPIILCLMQFFCCYTSRSEDLLKLLAGTKLILSKDKNIMLGMMVSNALAKFINWCKSWMNHIIILIIFVAESTIADDIIKRLKFADVDKTAKFPNTIHASLYYHPEAFIEPR